MYVLYWRKGLLYRLRFLLVLGVVLAAVFAGWYLLYTKKTVPTMRTWPIYQGNPEQKAVAFTFTVDWGEEYLPAILTVFQETGTRATFFPTGQWASRHPELVKKMVEGGHEIGNHGYSHSHPDSLSREENRQDILQGEQALMNITGKKPAVYSPPYGESRPQVVSAAGDLGYKFIMWTINTGDYLPNTKPEDILNTVVPQCQNGAIVLMHPTEPTSKALPELIKQLKERGYDLMTVSEIL